MNAILLHPACARCSAARSFSPRSQPAAAVTLSTKSPHPQVGSAPVFARHAVIARLTTTSAAGGNYIATCASPADAATSGQRTLSTDNVIGGLSLGHDNPRVGPTIVNMPGVQRSARRLGGSAALTAGRQERRGGYTHWRRGHQFQTGNGGAPMQQQRSS